MLTRAHPIRARHTRTIAKRSSGFALMDVLTAILLFSVGVLALVGLQSAMARAQTEAKIRADASYLANDAIGRIWSDINMLSEYIGSKCDAHARCEEWQDLVESTLPQGVGSIAAGSGAGDITITISWTMPSGESHKFVTETSINKSGG